jgi:signal transduction histidine kinase
MDMVHNFNPPFRMVCVVLLIAGLGCIRLFPESAESETIYTILTRWNIAEKHLNAWAAGQSPGERQAVLMALDNLEAELRVFVRGPLYQAHFVTSFSPEKHISRITRRIEALREEILKGRIQEAREHSFELNNAIIAWQSYDADLMNRIQLSYFRLILILAAVIIALVGILRRNHLSLLRSQLKEQGTAAFSRRIFLAQEAERSRIAMELHDTVIPGLRRLGLGARGEAARDHTTLIKRIREICGNLMPPDFRHIGLADGIQNLCLDFQKRTSVECRLNIGENLRIAPLSPEMQIQCYRLVQEALTNIEKHAEASEVSVVLRNSSLGNGAALLICVTDDGVGIAGKPSGLGIRGMYERAAILGGELTFLGEKGEGLMVKIEIPLAP